MNRYVSNTLWLIGEKILRLIAGFALGIWIARHLGPEHFGVYSYILSFVSLFSTIATLGLDGIVVKEIVKHEKETNTYIGTTFALKLIGAALTILLIFLTTLFTNNEWQTNALILTLGASTIFQSFNVVDIYFQSRVISKYSVYANTLSLVISSLAKIIFILYDYETKYFIYILILDALTLSIGYIYFYKKQHLRISEWRFSKGLAVKLLKNSWPLIISGFVIAIYMRIDQILIEKLLNVENVGQYAAAVKLSEAWYFIPMAIGTSLLPAIINTRKQSISLYYKRLQSFYLLMTWIAIIVAIPVTMYSHEIIYSLYGAQYSNSSEVLAIHIWTGVFLSMGIASGKWYLAENYTKGLMYKALFGAIVNIGLNIILIPLYGITGAAIAALFGHLSANILYDILDKKSRIQLKYKIRAFFPIYLIRTKKYNNEKIYKNIHNRGF